MLSRRKRGFSFLKIEDVAEKDINQNTVPEV